MTIDFLGLTERLERVYSPRLALRQVSLSDAWPLYQTTTNPDFNRYLMWDRPDDDIHVIDRVDSIVEATRRGRMSAVSAVVKATGEWVSLFRFQPHAVDPGLVEMGVWTHYRFWHDQYTLELGRMCVDAAFAFSDTRILVGASSPHNKSSCRLLELCGLVPTKLVNRPHEGGTEVELQEFQIERERWTGETRQLAFSHVVLPSDGHTPASAGVAGSALPTIDSTLAALGKVAPAAQSPFAAEVKPPASHRPPGQINA